jgi:poly-gamma-glutamate synthesis protein (capsule biosynthesis protein)
MHSFFFSLGRHPKTLHRVRHFGVCLVTIFSLVACQQSLWGAAPPAPTAIVPTQPVTATFPPLLTPTFTAIPPTATPVDLNAAQVWASPAVPPYLQDKFRAWGFQVVMGEQQDTNLYIDVVQPAPGAMHVSNWTYVLVAPFPTLADGVASQDLLSTWAGSPAGPFGQIPLLMEESTLQTFTALWGPPGLNVVQVTPANEIADTAWNSMPAWAIIPFEQLEPKWKVLVVDGQSPIEKSYDSLIYPLDVAYRLMCVNPCQVPGDPQFSFQNYDPSKLATVILTGVTAMTRATARTMDVKGITYPGEVIRDMLLEADITHINNEVPFYAGCPAPDPKQETLVFCSNPRYIELLTDIGTDVVELSGDHFADYREVGMIETLDIYDEYDLPYYGGGRNVEDGRKPLLMEVNGNKLMFIGCNYKTIYASATDTVPGAVPCDFDYMTEQIALYRAQGYLPISTFQYHEFESLEARPQQVEDFRRMADAGAVVVSGSQAHVPQVMEFYEDAFIHYGLGNLFFDQMDKFGPKLTQREFIDRHVFYDGRYLGVELITTFLEDYARPRFMTVQERDQFLSEYFEESGWDYPQAAY